VNAQRRNTADLYRGGPGDEHSAVGFATGSLVHVVAAAYRLSMIFQASATAHTLLKVAGAAYLIWLGVGYLRKAPSTALTPDRVPHRSHLRIFRESALVEIFNPKTALFFPALLPQFVEVAAGPVVPQVLLLA
jgi:threonine/homoserine/homoserine lactone efflux protein